MEIYSLKKISAIFLLLFFFHITQGKEISISGHIIGLENDTLFIHYLPVFTPQSDGPVQSDTIIARKGKFSYTLPVNEPLFFSISPKQLIMKYESPGLGFDLNQIFMLVSENNIHVKGEIIENYIEYTADGTPFNQQYASHRMTGKKNQQLRDSVMSLANFYTQDPSAPMVSSEVVYDLYDQHRELRKELAKSQLDYIQKNSQNDLSAFYLCIFQSYEVFNSHIETLHPHVKEGVFKNMIEGYIRQNLIEAQIMNNRDKITEGSKAPDFTLKDINGNEFRLSEIKEKFIVLDFWGSWCSWCITGFPRMKEYHNKYKEKAAFIGIACKDTEEAWKKAVEKHKLDWTQLINEETEDINKNVAVSYAVKGFPTKIILNKDLTIHTVSIGEGDEFYKILDELLKTHTTN